MFFQPPQPGMGGAFHVIYIMIALMIAFGAGLAGGLVWGLLTSKETARDKTRAGLIWLLLLTLLGAGLLNSEHSEEWILNEHDIEHLRAEEISHGRLRVMGKLADGNSEIVRAEAVVGQDQFGFEEVRVWAFSRDARGEPSEQDLDYTMDIPDGIERVVFGNGELVLWGRSLDESLEEAERLEEEYNLKRWSVSFDPLWKKGEVDAMTWEDGITLGGMVLDEIRRVYLGKGAEGDGAFIKKGMPIDENSEFYKDRVSGRVMAFKAVYGDGTFMIIDNPVIQPTRIHEGGGTFLIVDKREEESRARDINVIIGGEDGQMTWRVFKRK
jgi:hypothetical protein